METTENQTPKTTAPKTPAKSRRVKRTKGTTTKEPEVLTSVAVEVLTVDPTAQTTMLDKAKTITLDVTPTTSLDDADVEKVSLHIQSILNKSGVQMMVDVGKYIMDVVYGGDFQLFLKKGRKSNPLSKIAEHANIPKRTLRTCLKMHILFIEHAAIIPDSGPGMPITKWKAIAEAPEAARPILLKDHKRLRSESSSMLEKRIVKMRTKKNKSGKPKTDPLVKWTRAQDRALKVLTNASRLLPLAQREAGAEQLRLWLDEVKADIQDTLTKRQMPRLK